MCIRLLQWMCCLLIGILSSICSLAQTLEIHQISVGQGDAGLIVVRDTSKLVQALKAHNITLPQRRTEMLKTAIDKKIPLNGTVLSAVLIDAGEKEKHAERINTYLKKMGVDSLSYAMFSHYDSDHIGGFSSFEALFRKIGTVYDRGEKQKGSGVYKTYKATAKKHNRTTIEAGTKKVLHGEGSQRIEMICTSANSGLLGLEETLNAENENDLSLSWVLQYGCFRFFTGGDLSGYELSPKMDIETPLVKQIQEEDFADFNRGSRQLPKGHICAFKVNHHGSNHSTNDTLLQAFSPVAAIISCGYRSTYEHPREEPIAKLDTCVEHYYVTSLYQYSEKHGPTVYNIGAPSSKGVIAGDVVIVVDDTDIHEKSNFLIFWNGNSPGEMVSEKKMKTPSAAGLHIFNCHHRNATVEALYLTEK